MISGKFWFSVMFAVMSVMVIGVPKQACASDIKHLELAELPSRAEVVALAKVVKVQEKALDSRKPVPYDEVTIKVASVIKGKLERNEVTVLLQPRGEKGFDPALKVGDTGVFFLREVSQSQAKLAYWGSVAVFQKPNFVVADQARKPKEAIMEAKRVKLETSKGDIIIELDEKSAPVTVKNFLQYVEEGFYNGTIFHRVIPNFMIQGGGFTPDMAQKETHPPIVNEAANGLKNLRGTLAMARTSNPNSATCQFFINQKDNNFLDYVENRSPGYTVFAKVVEGMSVVDAIVAVKTGQKGMFKDVPVEPVVIKSAKVVPAKQDY
ncbi:MAG TPA: peptidylprolyl isomerase [Sedimentisphaerales bacterium]|nr:peptidylprolyl isomerase [Sedimentisphaerales bacterium]